MLNWQARQLALNEGSAAAVREWTRLALQPDSRVDVFSVIARANIWLVYQRLRNLYGVFERRGTTCGILLHSGHPVSVQRFTAAHEYGHFVLGHSGSLDSEHQLYEPTDDPQESAAQAFAANFLMPLPFVNRCLDRLGLSTPEHLSAEDVYQLGLEMGTSYRAALSQLQTLNKMPRDHADALRKIRPKQIKLALARVQAMANPRADVWRVDDRSLGRRLQPLADDEVHVAVTEPSTTGYRWTAAHADGADLAQLIADETLRDSASEFFGGDCIRHVAWRLTQPGRLGFHFRLLRPWERNGQSARSFDLAIDVAARDYRPDQPAALSRQQRTALLSVA
jgi:Zn-dependent peptidase ImmA (M78 family)